MSLIRKVWGLRQRLLTTKQCEIDLLQLEEDSACSIHSHEHKINRFVLIEGSITIKSDLGATELQLNTPFDVEPNCMHQFIINEDSVMVELAFVKDGEIDANDIERIKQGGKFCDGMFLTLDELKENNWI